MRVEVYGWSELESLSDSPRKQLDLLDRYIPEAESLKLEVSQQKNELKKAEDAIVALAQEIKTLLPSLANAAEIELELKNLSTPELNAAFADSDSNRAAGLALAQIVKTVEELESKISLKETKTESGQIQFGVGLENALASQGKALAGYNWWIEIDQKLRQSSQQAQSQYLQLVSTLADMRNQIAKAQSGLDLQRIEIEDKLNSLAEQSGQKDFKSALARREQLSEKANAARSTQTDVDAKYAKLLDLLDQRRVKVLPALNTARTALFESRSKKATAIAAKLATLKAANKVQISLTPLGDRGSFARALGCQEKNTNSGLLKNIDKQYLAKDYPGYYAARFTPHEFVSLLLGGVENAKDLAISYVRLSSGLDKGKIVRLAEGGVHQEGDSLVEVSETGKEVGRWPTASSEWVQVKDGTKIWQHLSPYYYEGEIQLYPDVKKLNALLELDRLDIEDSPRITLDGRPIEGLSPGQRCSALIPVILVEGDVPLIIDQPEDNLDNKLIFDLVVDILRSLKERRQVIVATHNPNIPVSGDAEQVIISESPSKEQCRVVTQGSIDDETVVCHIKEVMEGGDKAFEMRMKKYGFKPR